MRCWFSIPASRLPERGPKLDASRKNDVCLIPHVTNIIPSDSVAQRSLSSATYANATGMTNQQCIDFCDDKGWVSIFEIFLLLG